MTLVTRSTQLLRVDHRGVCTHLLRVRRSAAASNVCSCCILENTALSVWSMPLANYEAILKETAVVAVIFSGADACSVRLSLYF